MIANPDVADVFRKRAKVVHVPNFLISFKSLKSMLFNCFSFNIKIL